MLSKEKEGSLANAKVAPALQAFVTELKSTLSTTASTKDIPAAMKKLRDAEAGMADLTKTLSAQQVDLMHEGQAEEASLLLGVLMTRQKEPFEKQLEVLRSSEFSKLPVAQELLAKQDKSTPLFQQVAAYMDHHNQTGKVAVDEKAQSLAKTIAYFSKRVDALQKEGVRMKKVHETTMNKFQVGLKGRSEKSAQKLQIIMRRADHEYRKRIAANDKQLKMMEDVVAALKRGDVDALKRAQAALQASMKAMQAQTGNFLHLLQIGHRLQQKDCPYCAAQCVDKCHTAGKSYVTCLTDCADAGK